MSFESTYDFFDEAYTDAQKKAIATFCKKNFSRGTNYAYAFIVKYNLAYVVDDTADCPGFVIDALKDCLDKLGKLDAKNIYDALRRDERLWFGAPNASEFLLDVSAKRYSTFHVNGPFPNFIMTAENGKIYAYAGIDTSIPECIWENDDDVRPSVYCQAINKEVKSSLTSGLLEKAPNRYGQTTYRFAIENVHSWNNDELDDAFGLLDTDNGIYDEAFNNTTRNYLVPLLKKNGKEFNCPNMVDFVEAMIEVTDGDWTHFICEFPEDFFEKTYETLGKLGQIYEQTADREGFLNCIGCDGDDAFALGPALIWEYYDGTQTLESEEEYHKEIAEAYKDLKAKFLNADDNFDDTLKELDALDSEEEDSEESEEN